MIATYVANNQFTVSTNRTLEFVAGRRVRADCGVDGYKYCTVLSSSYGAPNTTVTIEETTLTANLATVLYGIVEPGSLGSLPWHEDAAYFTIMALSYDDAILSGDPIVVRFSNGGSYVYVKVYPTISSTINPTDDSILTAPCTLNNDDISGDMSVIEISSGGTNYYIQCYPTIYNIIYNKGGGVYKAMGYSGGITISGTPRIIRIDIDETPYYAKIYPTKE